MMRAVVKEQVGAGHLALKEWPEPSPDHDEVKIAVAAAGICGTDIHILDGDWPCNPPVVLGHEFCGTVTEVGDSVSNFQPGDRVVASNPAKTCGACYHCRAGNPFMCSKRVSVGYMIDGAFGQYVCITELRCHLLPDNVSFRQAALGEPLSAAVHGLIERTTVRSGDLVLISGPGCIGILAMIIAKLQGARTIVLGLTKDVRRLSLAKELGADLVIDSAKEDVADIVHQFSSGDGIDLACECAGVPSSLDTCLEVVRKEGTVLQLGIYSRRFEADFNKIVMKELKMIGSFGYVWTSWRRSLQLLRDGKVKADQMISHELPLKDFAEAFQLTRDGTATKVVFNPQKD
jgi:L-iditol 2-dehydrogenase